MARPTIKIDKVREGESGGVGARLCRNKGAMPEAYKTHDKSQIDKMRKEIQSYYCSSNSYCHTGRCPACRDRNGEVYSCICEQVSTTYEELEALYIRAMKETGREREILEIIDKRRERVFNFIELDVGEAFEDYLLGGFYIKIEKVEKAEERKRSLYNAVEISGGQLKYFIPTDWVKKIRAELIVDFEKEK